MRACVCVLKPMKEEANDEARGEEGGRKRRTDAHASAGSRSVTCYDGPFRRCTFSHRVLLGEV